MINPEIETLAAQFVEMLPSGMGPGGMGGPIYVQDNFVISHCKGILRKVRKEGLKLEFFKYIIEEYIMGAEDSWYMEDIQFMAKYLGIRTNTKGEYFAGDVFIRVTPGGDDDYSESDEPEPYTITKRRVKSNELNDPNLLTDLI